MASPTNPPTTPTHDHDIERAIIGATLLPPPRAANPEQLTTRLTVDHFHNPPHATIWAQITNRAQKHQPIDAQLVAHDLATTGQLDKIGGGAYLHTCLQAATPYIDDYAAKLEQYYRTRQLLLYARSLAQAALTADPYAQAEAVDRIITAAANALLPPAGLNGRPHNLRLTPASHFPIRAVRWLWQGRVPLGEITLVPGREGVSKSIFLAWLASVITNGNLEGRYHHQPRAVLYAAQEDSWNHTVAPRLLAAGANLDLVYRIDTVTEGPLELPRDTQYLPEVTKEVDAAALLCDPILSLVSAKINPNQARELRTALEPLRAAADQAGISVAGLVHFNKGASTDIGTLIAGSRAWHEVARASLAIAQDKDADDYTCVVSQSKNNLGRLDLPSLTYTIDSVLLDTADGEQADVGRLRWVGESDVTAEELLVGNLADRPLSDSTIAVIEYVTQSNGVVSLQDIQDHFRGTIKPVTVRQILSRSCKRGDLVSQTRGNYEPGKKHGRARGGAENSRSRTTTPPPLSQALQHTHTQMGGYREGVTEGVTGVAHVTGAEADVTCDTVTEGLRARARARDASQTPEHEEPSPTLELDENSPTATTEPGKPPERPAPEPDDEPEEREWYP